jgi:hypothetical protein
MLNNIEDIKLFIEWCKEHKIKSFKFKDLQFELSELGFLEQTEDYADKLQSDLAQTNFEAKQANEEDEDLLFWSSKG